MSRGGAPSRQGTPKQSLDMLWHSNAPWVPTGYGQQTAITAPLLAEQLGVRLAFSAFHGLKGSRLNWRSDAGNDYVVYPAGQAPYGNDVVGAHAKHWFEGRNGMVVILTDPWVMNPQIMGMLPVMAWVPIDHDPIIPATLDWFHKSGAVPLAMSPFGERVMREAGLDPLYAPHGIDCETFAPVKDREAIKESMGIDPDCFLVGMFAANKGTPSRKNFGAAIGAFAQFQEKIGRGKAVLYIHSMIEDKDGEDIPGICKVNGVVPMIPDQYVLALGQPPSHVATAMQAADVVLNPAWGEGFGLTMAESNACGTPVIGTDFSAIPDVIPPEGGNWLIGGEEIWTQFGSYQVRADKQLLVQALEQAWEERGTEAADRRREAARTNALRFEASKVVNEHWKYVLPEAQRRFKYVGEARTVFD